MYNFTYNKGIIVHEKYTEMPFLLIRLEKYNRFIKAIAEAGISMHYS